MSYRLSAEEAAGLVRGQYFRFLLIEGKSPIRLDLELALRRRFPGALVERQFPENSASLQAIDWQSYDLVLISCPCSIAGDVEWLRSAKQGGQYAPVVIVLAEQDELRLPVVWGNADVHLPLNESNIEFAARMDSMLEVGRVLWHYPLALPHWHILEVLHNSENAVVFLVENLAAERAVVKRFKFDVTGLEDKAFDSFLQDAYALKQARHPGLVGILDVGVTESAVYLVMEYVPGHTLKFLLAEYDMPDVRQVIAWFRQITQALGVIHSLSLLHRDLKASNVLVREDGTPVLVDFGIENKLLLDSGFLQEDEIYCTPFYVSPERIVGEPASVQSDLYALGVLLFEMLACEKPYVGASLGDVLQQHIFGSVPPLPEGVSMYQPLVNSLLSKAPECRPDSAQAVLEWLDRHALMV